MTTINTERDFGGMTAEEYADANKPLRAEEIKVGEEYLMVQYGFDQIWETGYSHAVVKVVKIDENKQAEVDLVQPLVLDSSCTDEYDEENGHPREEFLNKDYEYNEFYDENALLTKLIFNLDPDEDSEAATLRGFYGEDSDYVFYKI